MLHVALGDSITYGYSTTTDEATYIQRLVKRLAPKEPLHTFLQAKPGWTSKQLLKSLNNVQDCIWDEAQFVTLMIGGNDLLHAAPWLMNGGDAQIMKVADRLYQNVTEIVNTVKRPHHRFVIATLYNPFPHSIRAEEFTDKINKSIRLVASRQKLSVADVRKAFAGHEGKYIEGYKRGHLRDMKLIDNPVHPNDTGHAVIARVFLATFRRTQRPARRGAKLGRR